jgi:hypothetical protein
VPPRGVIAGHRVRGSCLLPSVGRRHTGDYSERSIWSLEVALPRLRHRRVWDDGDHKVPRQDGLSVTECDRAQETADPAACPSSTAIPLIVGERDGRGHLLEVALGLRGLRLRRLLSDADVTAGAASGAGAAQRPCRCGIGARGRCAARAATSSGSGRDGVTADTGEVGMLARRG